MHTSVASLCVGNEQIAFLANSDERPRGCSSRIAEGPKLFRLVVHQRLFDQVRTLKPVQQVNLWSNHSFQELCKCSL